MKKQVKYTAEEVKAIVAKKWKKSVRHNDVHLSGHHNEFIVLPSSAMAFEKMFAGNIESVTNSDGHELSLGSGKLGVSHEYFQYYINSTNSTQMEQVNKSSLIDVLISGYRDQAGNKFTRANAIELLQRDAISTLNDYEFSNEIPDHLNLCLIESMDDARIFIGWMDDTGTAQSNVIDTLVTLPVHSEMRIDHQADGDGLEYWVRTIDADEMRNAVVTEHYY